LDIRKWKRFFPSRKYYDMLPPDYYNVCYDENYGFYLTIKDVVDKNLNETIEVKKE